MSNGTTRTVPTNTSRTTPSLSPKQWPVLAVCYSKAAQATVTRFHDTFSTRCKNGTTVAGQTELAQSGRRVTYNQSGFDLETMRSRDGYTSVCVSKLGWVTIRYH